MRHSEEIDSCRRRVPDAGVPVGVDGAGARALVGFPLSRRRFQAAALLACAAPVRAAVGRDVRPHGADRLAAIVADPARGAERARDAARHPLETLRFFGVEPGHTVIEVAPGDGWYTAILAPYLRDRGRLYAAHHPADSTSEYRRRSRARFDVRLAADAGRFGRVVVGEQPEPGRGFRGIPPRGQADRVLTFRNLHNWMKAGHLDENFRAFHAALRPGGVLGVVEHRARPGTSIAAMIESGYMTESFVIERARAAGFRLDASSEVNANPRDPADHPHGVWSLPPTLRGGAVGRERYLAIGESDRMTLRLRRD
jgi:predicted methyltransferase